MSGFFGGSGSGNGDSGSSDEDLLHTEVIDSSKATVDIDISEVSSDYEKLRIEWDIETASNAAYQDLFMILKLAGTFYSSNYVSTVQAMSGSVGSGSNVTSNIQLSSTISHSDTEQSGKCWINNKPGTKRKGAGDFVGDAGNGWVMGKSGWMYNGADATAAIDAFRFSATTNFTGGEIRVYGEKK